jgi:hypothetical protein
MTKKKDGPLPVRSNNYYATVQSDLIIKLRSLLARIKKAGMHTEVTWDGTKHWIKMTLN